MLSLVNDERSVLIFLLGRTVGLVLGMVEGEKAISLLVRRSLEGGGL
jgi:hypothetical protein